MVVLVPPQDYLAQVYSGTFHGSFPSWMMQALTGAYPGGKLSPHHLWFLAYVLVLTFVLLPCFLWLRSAQGRAAHAKLGRLAARIGL
jgi:predicted branched-subunit amino acid permease